MLAIASYDGSTNPTNHFSKFNRLMLVHRVSEDVKCHISPLTLMGPADEWFKKHKPRSIHSWHQLSSSFRRHFIVARKEEVERTKQVDDDQQQMVLKVGIRAGSPLWDDLQWRGCHRLDDFIHQAQEYINWEDAQIGAFGGSIPFLALMVSNSYWPYVPPRAGLTGPHQFAPLAGISAMSTTGFSIASTGYGLAPAEYSAFQHAFGTRTASPAQSFAPSDALSGSKRGGKSKGKNPRRTGTLSEEKYNLQYSEYTNLVDTWEYIFLAMKQQIHFRRPQPIRRDGERKDSKKLCRYHNDVGHHTNECQHLKDEIKNLIKLGHLHQYAKAGAHTSQASAAIPPQQTMPH
ncbi:uncharacterized protein LOC133814973 [Humulus lupulus]|uniref:uncharacterized protein LOC133814973 n=1 Tax=Humulus lupulus TaxID=3486 RepID=UPI002B4103DB|nr:uncharacterized protein LOC133814973 [Humulus lupulus]